MQEPNLTMRGNTMAVDNTNRFTGKAELYVQARPRYADALFSYMKEDLQLRIGSVVADVGSGTGIMSDQLLSAGYVVYAVEPNEDMRKQAELQLGKCVILFRCRAKLARFLLKMQVSIALLRPKHSIGLMQMHLG
jgi:predicted RNA methylase